MASRKKPPESMSLFAAPIIAPTPEPTFFLPLPDELPSPRPASEPPPPAESAARPRLRLVPKPDEPEEEVLVEKQDDDTFVVTKLSHKGTTSCTVVYTRAQLTLFLRRIPAALEVG